MISEQLIPHIKKIVGVDISQGSVNRYNTLATEKLGLSPETMKAVAVELKGQPGELEGTKFDVVVVRLPITPSLPISEPFLRSSISSPRSPFPIPQF